LSAEEGSEIQDGLAHLTRQKTVPNVFIGGNHVGGASDVMKANQAGTLHTLLKNALPDYD
jgi:glutaredoxin 3